MQGCGIGSDDAKMITACFDTIEIFNKCWNVGIPDVDGWERREITTWDVNGPPSCQMLFIVTGLYIAELSRAKATPLPSLMGYIELDRNVSVSSLTKWFPYIQFSPAKAKYNENINPIYERCFDVEAWEMM